MYRAGGWCVAVVPIRAGFNEESCSGPVRMYQWNSPVLGAAGGGWRNKEGWHWQSRNTVGGMPAPLCWLLGLHPAFSPFPLNLEQGLPEGDLRVWPAGTQGPGAGRDLLAHQVHALLSQRWRLTGIICVSGSAPPGGKRSSEPWLSWPGPCSRPPAMHMGHRDTRTGR